MSITPELLAAYTATDYLIEVNPRVTARPGERGAEVDALLLARQVQTAAVITACNPYSLPLSEAENAEAQRAVIGAVESMGLFWLPAEGRGRDGAWPPEPSLCILGIGLSEADGLSRRFRQNAFLWLEAGHPALVVTTNAREPESSAGGLEQFSGSRA